MRMDADTLRSAVRAACPELAKLDPAPTAVEATERDGRAERIRDRARALYRAGWYDAEDGKTIVKWLENGVCMAALEGILWLAEDDCRRAREVRPETLKQESKP